MYIIHEIHHTICFGIIQSKFDIWDSFDGGGREGGAASERGEGREEKERQNERQNEKNCSEVAK